MNFWPLRPGDEANAYLHGTYLNQLGMRAVIWAVVAPMTLLTVGLFLLSLFLTGMLLQRMDFMRDPFAHPKTMKILGLVGTFGLLFCASSFFFQGQKGQATYTQAIEIAFGPMLAAGYLLLLAVWTAKGWAKPIQKLFANVGRIALTAYISQSIICSVIFYGWGFGKFGSMNLSQQLATAALIDVAIIIAATVYLRYFSIGPVEWLWRSISERRKIPFRDRIVAAPSG